MGLACGVIAAELFVTESTVKFHVRNLLKKTGCKNRQELRAAVENAFIAMVEDAGKRIGHDAVKLAVKATAGFPYMMQLVGYRFWAASRGEEITLQDVERGAAQAAEEFRLGVLETTLSELSPKDVEFCLAMLNGTGPSRLSDIAARMGVKSNYASQYKRRLLLAGVIEERGAYLEFCIPGFRSLLAERFI